MQAGARRPRAFLIISAPGCVVNPPKIHPLELGMLLLTQHFKRSLPEDAETGEPAG
jgi:hypothetical protein